jgi:hypothetical protein
MVARHRLTAANKSRTFSVDFDGSAEFDFVGVRVLCIGGSGDECARTYDVRVTVEIERGNSGNDCSQTRVRFINAQASCPDFTAVLTN